MNWKMLKTAFIGFVLSLSTAANAGLISTLYNSNNGGDAGGAVYFDVNVGTANLSITGFDINAGSTSYFDDFEVWLLSGLTSQGNETFLAWNKVATGSGTGAGENFATTVSLSNAFTLNANSLYGFALVAGSNFSHEYTNGDGSNQIYANADIALSFGSATNSPFTGGVFQPRVWNGAIHYNVSQVPEPTTLMIFALGVLGLASRRAKK